jgi:antitoxin (DNA-binding transcriptional repressor) of toxin-antitoxin stability system
MNSIESVDISKNPKVDLNKILDGKSYVILKSGKAIAELNPIKKIKNTWKRRIKKVKLKNNISTTDIIREKRDSE